MLIKKEIKGEGDKTKQLIGISEEGALQYNRNDDYLNLWTDVISMQRGSKNNLKYHFRKLREHNGWSVVDIEKDDDLAELGLAAHKEGKKLCDKERIQRILAAQLITKKEYQLLNKKKDKTRLRSNEHDAMRRYEVESFYLTEASEEVVKRDDNGRFRSEVLNYECYTAADSHLIALDQIDENNGVHVTDKSHRRLWKQTMKEILVSAGLANEESLILTNSILRGDRLSTFIETSVKRKQRIAQLFSMSLRGDIRKKPVQQLNKLLGLIGLGAIKLKTIKEEGKKIYLYTIPQESVDTLNEIVDRRKDKELRNQWHTKRESETHGRLFTKENPIKIPRTFRDIYPRKTPILCLVQDEIET